MDVGHVEMLNPCSVSESLPLAVRNPAGYCQHSSLLRLLREYLATHRLGSLAPIVTEKQ